MKKMLLISATASMFAFGAMAEDVTSTLTMTSERLGFQVSSTQDGQRELEASYLAGLTQLGDNAFLSFTAIANHNGNLGLGGNVDLAYTVTESLILGGGVEAIYRFGVEAVETNVYAGGFYDVKGPINLYAEVGNNWVDSTDVGGYGEVTVGYAVSGSTNILATAGKEFNTGNDSEYFGLELAIAF